MLTLNGPLPQWQRPDSHAVYTQQVQGIAPPHNIGDRIERPNLVEMNGFERLPMHLRLGSPQGCEYRKGLLLDRFRESGLFDQCPDFRKPPMRAMMRVGGGVVMRLIVCMAVRMAVCMAMIVCRFVVPPRGILGFSILARMHMNPAPVQPVARRFFHVQVQGGNIQCLQRVLHFAQVHPQIRKGGKNHVPARAADTVKLQDLHADAPNRLISAAATPPPKPLSTFTTVIPGTQELSMAKRALSPPKFMP